MSNKHTAGPWHAYHTHGYLVVESDNEKLHVKVAKGLGDSEDMANACLLATAPAMKNALVELVLAQDRIRDLPMFPTTFAVESANFKLQDAMKAARAAIKKATGAE